ncbi:MAG: sulfatase [Lysobacterales bacterium CG02_land_8_20_14_3_00_62_12]|nr:MAG: sulfatase [Xanthomonadales bacterium CG02_land_8_20_14_3_00_62_12]
MKNLLRPVLGLAIAFFALALLTRCGLLVAARQELPWLLVWISVPMGLVYDLATFALLALPLVALQSLLPKPGRWRTLHSVLVQIAVLLALAVLVLVAVSEWLFWDEFGVRFNFIAVDYLVYTTEVVGNIWQSYPMPAILCGLALTTAVIYGLLSSWWWPDPQTVTGSQRGAFLLFAITFAALDLWLLDADSLALPKNNYADQIGRNGIYQFFSAYRHAELDYLSFYRQQPADTLDGDLRRLLATPEARFRHDHGIERDIVNRGPEQHPNIVLISIESLSADFMSSFGNSKGLTPNLDRLASNSQFFTQLYATGNRTVRGLEALSIGVPPSPGEAIVKRPHNDHLFGLGSVLAAKDYQLLFLYGGYSYFDNMQQYFTANGYQVIDRTALAPAQIHHETIWGVADEDLFTLALNTFDASAARGRPFFGQIMTVSNHRPYTYPEGRIDIPSKTGRDGAVKYTDWAIGNFIERARRQPWFDNTVFVIVADHCASSAGRVDLPVRRYHIPALFYSPKYFPPERVDRLMSQIDLAPTLLGKLGMSYRSQFFGYDLAQLAPGRERALLATYQQLGLLKAGVLSILKPQRLVLQQLPDADGDGATPLPTPRDDLLAEAITWYQASSVMFQRGELRDAEYAPPESER